VDAVVSTFHVDLKLIVIQLVNFAIVFFVLYRYALKPLATLMNDRKKTIAQGVDDATTNAALVEQTKKLFEQESIKAREEAQHLLHTMKQDIEAKRVALIADAHEQSEKVLADTRKQLEQEKISLVNEARKDIAALVVQSTEKILGAVSKELDSSLIDQSLHDL